MTVYETFYFFFTMMYTGFFVGLTWSVLLHWFRIE